MFFKAKASLLYAATFVPVTISYLSLGISVGAFTMLKTTQPFSIEFTSVRPIVIVNRKTAHLPSKDTMPRFLVVDVAPFVLSPISVYEMADPMHLVIFEVPLIAAPVGPDIFAVAFHPVVDKGTVVT